MIILLPFLEAKVGIKSTKSIRFFCQCFVSVLTYRVFCPSYPSKMGPTKMVGKNRASHTISTSVHIQGRNYVGENCLLCCLFLYCLVWATKLSLAAIGLVIPVLVLGYKSLKLFNVSSTSSYVDWEICMNIFWTANTSRWQHHFLTYELKKSPKYLVSIPTYFSKLVWLSFKQLVCVAGSIIFWHTNMVSFQKYLIQIPS